MSASTAAAAAPPPLALYLHFPWCVRKCPYCDFNSHAVRGELPEQAYVAALLADLDWELRMHPARELVSVYCGGGTPSLFSADAFAELFAGIRARLPLAADVEITVEVNPGTLRAGYFEQLRGLGCNRLSIGVQSFDDGRLRALGRV
ncbi:MAG TPA: radical SAM protein, partial [Gammaproteobacteria bacterium]